jgi:hypothetical protein
LVRAATELGVLVRAATEVGVLVHAATEVGVLVRWSATEVGVLVRGPQGRPLRTLVDPVNRHRATVLQEEHIALSQVMGVHLPAR